MSLRRMINLYFPMHTRAQSARTKPMLILLISLRNPSFPIESGHRSARGPVRTPKELQLRKMTGELHLSWVSEERDAASADAVKFCIGTVRSVKFSKFQLTTFAAWRHHVEYVACENCLDDGVNRKEQHVLSLSGPCGHFHKNILQPCAKPVPPSPSCPTSARNSGS